MSGYVVTRRGTFGTVTREYTSELTGERMCIVQWGPLGWISPVKASNVFHLRSRYESEAREEAERIMERLENEALSQPQQRDPSGDK